jgi:hypothetical protein
VAVIEHDGKPLENAGWIRAKLNKLGMNLPKGTKLYAIPPGWTLVPEIPTYEMVQTGARVVKDNLPYHTGTKVIYEAMLNAVRKT